MSIIIPLYNCSRYLPETLDSVRAQTFESWEAILVDDNSDDDSYEIALNYAEMDSRFVAIKQEANRGAGMARNRALPEARGRFIAYLDSDDLWYPNKLETQIRFMVEQGYGACYTSYETINEDGSHRNIIHVDKSTNYKRFLKKPVTCSHTIMFDTTIIDRSLLVMPDIRKRQDAATWLNVIKRYGCLHGLDKILAANRKRPNSLSSNKASAVRNTWLLYTQIEQLKKPYAAYCLIWQMYHAALKRMGDH